MERSEGSKTPDIVVPKLVDIYVGGIDQKFVEGLISRLDDIEYKSPNDILRFIIDGYGGSLDPALALADRMLSMSNPIITEARSRCYSADVLIFSCGAERWAHPRSRFMLHHAQLPKYEYSGPLNEIGADLRPVFQQNKQFIYTIADNIGFDRHSLYRETKKDTWFGVNKARDYYHLVTDILPDTERKK